MIRPPLSKFRAAGAAVLAVLLAACGGGGDGPPPAPEITVNINLQNQQQVARASFGSSVSGAVGGFTGAGSGGAVSPLVVKRAQSAALATRKRIAEDVSAELCPGGGAADATATDTAPPGESVGDSAQVTFINCNDGAGTVASGVLRLTISSLGSSSIGFAISTSNFSVRDTATGYTASLDGSFGLSLQVSPGVFTSRLSVANELVLDASVGAISDTVSLLRGYATEATYTVSDATTRAVAAGPVDSVASGGTFNLSTPQALVQTDNEAYPHAGQILAVGKTGKLRATVLSNTQVRLEVDEDGNGSYERNTVVNWTDLL